jgi:hypothetical protein
MLAILILPTREEDRVVYLNYLTALVEAAHQFRA